MIIKIPSLQDFRFDSLSTNLWESATILLVNSADYETFIKTILLSKVNLFNYHKIVYKLNFYLLKTKLNFRL